MNFHLYFLYYWLRLFFFQWKLRIPSISEGPPTAAIRRSQSEYSSIVADTKFQRISFKIQTSQQSPVFHLYGHLCLKLRELNNCFNKSCMPHSETEIWKKLMGYSVTAWLTTESPRVLELIFSWVFDKHTDWVRSPTTQGTRKKAIQRWLWHPVVLIFFQLQPFAIAMETVFIFQSSENLRMLAKTIFPRNQLKN